MGSYTPVRSDGIVGEEKLSEPSDVILPGKLWSLNHWMLLYACNLCNTYLFSLSFQSYSKSRHLFSREIRLREKH
jgi:hypothetical protein